MQGEGEVGAEQQSRPDEYRYTEHEQPEQCVSQPQERTEVPEGGERSAAEGSPADQAREAYNARAAGGWSTGEIVSVGAAVAGTIMENAGHVLEVAGVAGVGAVIEVGAEVYHLFSTIGEAHEVTAREATFLGARHAVEVAGSDAAGGSGAHLEAGAPYTAEELGERSQAALNDAHARGETTSLMFQNTKGFSQQYEAGQAAVAKELNGVLGKAATPAERQAALKAFVGAARGMFDAHQAERTAQERARHPLLRTTR